MDWRRVEKRDGLLDLLEWIKLVCPFRDGDLFMISNTSTSREMLSKEAKTLDSTRKC